MNADLEETLSELGPGYRELALRLRAGRTVEPRRPVRIRRPWFGRAVALTAASLFAAIVLGLFARHPSADRQEALTVYTVAYAPTEEALEVLLASQRADGSWENDYLTRQNAAALREAVEPGARIAYRKAVRYLRSKGLSPLSAEELRVRGLQAGLWRARNV